MTEVGVIWLHLTALQLEILVIKLSLIPEDETDEIMSLNPSALSDSNFFPRPSLPPAQH